MLHTNLKNYSAFETYSKTPFISCNYAPHVYYVLHLFHSKNFYLNPNLSASSTSYLSATDLKIKSNSNNLVLSSFLFLKKSSMTAFFIMNMIDVPIRLKQTKSIYFKSFELPILRFVNYLMRGGLRNSALKRLTNAIFVLSHKWVNLSYTLSDSFNILNMFDTLNMFFFTTRHSYRPVGTINSDPVLVIPHLPLQHLFKPKLELSLLRILFQNFASLKPLFTFYIERIAKSIRKNSKNKSGKFKLIWRYVPPYKRVYVSIMWFVRDLKFQKSKTFNQRLYKSLESLFITPDLNLLKKMKDFIHYYVFKNFKLTLLKTLKSAVK